MIFKKMDLWKPFGYFVEYTRIEVKHFRDTLLEHIGNVKKSVAERTQVQDENNGSGNDTDVDDADIRPIYNEEPMAEVQLTAECNIFAIGQQHTKQREIINEGRVDQYPEQCQVKSPMLDSSPDIQTTDNSKQSLETKFENPFNLEIKERMQKYTRFNAQSFHDAMICNMDSIGKYIREIILHQQRTPQLLKQKKMMQTQEDHSNPIQALNVDSLKVDLVVIQNTCSKKEDSYSEIASSKSVKESSLDYTTKDVHAIKYK
nr:hypothetical protein [Tanacetum cinerariifolium]